VLGYIFGGLMANGPHTRTGSPRAISSSSNLIFTVVYAPVVPEPETSWLTFIAAVWFVAWRRAPVWGFIS
jgi:hypothetical protein